LEIRLSGNVPSGRVLAAAVAGVTAGAPRGLPETLTEARAGSGGKWAEEMGDGLEAIDELHVLDGSEPTWLLHPTLKDSSPPKPNAQITLLITQYPQRFAKKPSSQICPQDTPDSHKQTIISNEAAARIS